jgi:hypothetical protein
MLSQGNRPSGRYSNLSLEGLIAHAHRLGSQGRQTIAELKVIRGRVEASRAQAEQRLLRATVALQGASDRLNAIRPAAG